MKRFWKWKDLTETGPAEGIPQAERVLFLNGTIAEESWFDDDVTPALFKEELNAGDGDIVVWINSPGGDCVAAAQIYNMLIDYKGNVTVKIDGIAASAASVIAMAGTKVLMSPVSMMMIHNPVTIAIGDAEDMLRNINYTGNLLLQKTYTENYLTKRKLKNDGVLPQYYAENAHEAIIDADTFEAVQQEASRRQMQFDYRKAERWKYPYTGMIVCAICGRRYKRKKTHAGPVWICPTFNSVGRDMCPSKQIPEEVLNALTADIDLETVERMIAENGNVLRVYFHDGTEQKLVWKDRSRADSWTEEMKQAAREIALKGGRKHGEC